MLTSELLYNSFNKIKFMEFRQSGLVSKFNKRNRRDLQIFLIPIIIFSIYLCVFNPGIATIDTFNQLHQISSGHFTNWHPFFHTFIEMACLKVYPSTLSVCILQILVFSLMWTAICKYNRNDDVEARNPFKLQVIFSVVICIIPINALYSITLWKDILFSYFLMFLCFLVYVMVDRKGNVDYKFIILISLVMAFVAQLRGNGMYVVAVVMVIYAIYLFWKRNRKMAALLLILTVTFILLISSLNSVYDVEDNEKDALVTKVAHMLADYDLNLEIEDGDRQKIHEVIDKDKNKDNFMPTDSDPTLAITNYHKMESDKGTYISLAIKYSLRNPLHCLEYLFGAAPMVWHIVRDKHWVGRPYYMDAEKDRLQLDFNRYYEKHNFTATEPYENLSYVNWGTPVFTFLNLLSMGIEGFAPTDTIFESPALYMYLSIILLMVIRFIIKSKEIYLMYVANFLNIIIVFASTPIQDNRYLYANLLVCYLIFIILLRFRQSSVDLSDVSPKNPVRYIFRLLYRLKIL